MKLLKFLNPFFPLNIPLLLWEAALFLTGNTADALRAYHEICVEILELVRP